MPCGEEKLWRAVVEQAMNDATNEQLNTEERTETIDWIYHGGFDFQIVCDLASVSTSAVKKKLLEKIIHKTRK
jgi:hypothetical protein